MSSKPGLERRPNQISSLPRAPGVGRTPLSSWERLEAGTESLSWELELTSCGTLNK